MEDLILPAIPSQDVRESLPDAAFRELKNGL
jgi:hypothetical protein